MDFSLDDVGWCSKLRGRILLMVPMSFFSSKISPVTSSRSCGHEDLSTYFPKQLYLFITAESKAFIFQASPIIFSLPQLYSWIIWHLHPHFAPGGERRKWLAPPNLFSYLRPHLLCLKSPSKVRMWSKAIPFFGRSVNLQIPCSYGPPGSSQRDLARRHHIPLFSGESDVSKADDPSSFFTYQLVWRNFLWTHQTLMPRVFGPIQQPLFQSSHFPCNWHCWTSSLWCPVRRPSFTQNLLATLIGQRELLLSSPLSWW